MKSRNTSLEKPSSKCRYRGRLAASLIARQVAVVLLLQLLCGSVRSGDLIGGVCQTGGHYYCQGYRNTSLTINWSGFAPGCYVRLFTANGVELTAVGDTGPGFGSITHTFAPPLVGYDFQPLFYHPDQPNSIVYDWRAAFAVISGDPTGQHYAASGGRVVTETDIHGLAGCCSNETYEEDTLVYNFSGRLPPALDENQTKECDAKTGGCSGPTCSSRGMASYSIHLLLASLHIEDTPISYNSPRGPSPDFKVAYNQRDAQQPTTFSYSNFGPKWTFNWLSYVTDDGPAAPAVHPAVYVRGGGTEVYSTYNSTTHSYAPNEQTLAVLVRTSDNTYERQFSNGAKEVFSKSDGSTSYPRRIFLTAVVDAAGGPDNTTELSYDTSFLRITTITDSLGQATNLTYTEPGDPFKISRVTDPFLRFAKFDYTAGKLTKITDPIGIESQFAYKDGSDFIETMTTPYGSTGFTQGGVSGNSAWLEATDPLGGKERVEYNDWANIPSAEESAPPGVHNTDLQYQNTLYWDRKAMAEAPNDPAKAQVTHWLATPDGKVSGIKASEKKALESRIWYTYQDQTDPTKVGKNALPVKVERLVTGDANQLSQYKYDSLGHLLRETDPVGRVTSYAYAANGTDVLTVFQRNPLGVSQDPDGLAADVIASNTYNGQHEPLTTTDAAGQTTIYEYYPTGQIKKNTNAKLEITTYEYGDGSFGKPIGYLTKVTSPAIGGSSASTDYTYDYAHRVSTVTTNPDGYAVATFYDELDRPTYVLYPDDTWEQFAYGNLDTGAFELDLTRSTDRNGRHTERRYNANRQIVSITDSASRTTIYNWCTCGSLTSITDPKGQTTTFNRDLQGRVYQKVFADGSTIDCLFEGHRLQSSTDALNRRTNYFYNTDDTISGITYTDTLNNQLVPPTPSVSYLYYAEYNRIKTMTTVGVGVTDYVYYDVPSVPPLNAGKLKSIHQSLTNETTVFTYDKLGRIIGQSIDGSADEADYDPLGRLATTHNALGAFGRVYDGLTSRIQTLTYPNGQTANYSYFDNNHDRRLQTLQNLAGGTVNLSRFDYTYDESHIGRIGSWSSLLGATSSGRWFQYDDAEQLQSARNASDATVASQKIDYGYDVGANRVSDRSYNPQGSTNNGTLNTYPAAGNMLNQLDNFSTSINGHFSSELPFAYDLVGNMTSDEQGRTFEWDAANRLIAVNYVGTTNRSEFTYDGLSRRVKVVEKTGSTVTSTKKFVWVGTRIVQERDASNVITRSYFAEGEQRGAPGGRNTKNYCYSRDHLGSIREMTNSTGGVEARYDYDPYGKRTKLSGTLDVDFGYTGHYHHGPTGFNLTLYRAYHPAVGRWINRDPIGEEGGPNLYNYVENDPIDSADPLGLRSKDFNTEPAAADAGALADFAAAGGALGTNIVEYGGWVCQSKCNKKFYFTGPTKGHTGKPPKRLPYKVAKDATTWSNVDEWEPCSGDDPIVGAHYTHPNGSLIPPFDSNWAVRQNAGVGITLTVASRRRGSSSPAMQTVP